MVNVTNKLPITPKEILLSYYLTHVSLLIKQVKKKNGKKIYWNNRNTQKCKDRKRNII